MNIKNLIDSNLLIANEAKETCIIGDYDFDLSFDIVLDNKGKYLFNLNQTTIFEFNNNDIQYTITDQDEMSWSLLSYKIYGTTHLAWLLMDLNKACCKKGNLFTVQESGTVIKFLSKQKINNIISILADMSQQ